MNDPFGDNSSFSYIAGYNNRVYLGPNNESNLLLRADADGSNQEEVSFSIAKDTTPHPVTGNVHNNSELGPFNSFGYSGCTPNVDCGPDNEDGRGLFVSDTLSGTEYLIYAANHTTFGDFDYI